MVKFQKNGITMLHKSDTPRAFVDGYDVLVTFEGQRAVRIPKQQFYLDINHFKEMPSLKDVLSLADVKADLSILPNVEIIGNKQYRQFSDGKNIYYLSEKFVKDMIYKSDEYTYYLKGNMIICCINEIVIEAICLFKKKTD